MVSRFTARQVGSVVKVDISTKEGNLKLQSRKYKVIVVNDRKSIESDWIAKNSITVKIPSE